ncbi:MAG: hypothetical protein K8953_03005, partial [Proteobacteria bacterium]|nr:hypothetical protein [Pseudomonadota bacterium]
ILAGCGGSALPIPVIATESTDVANKAESNTPDSIFLSAGEEPPVDTAKSSVKSAPPPAETPIVQVQKQEPKPKQEEEQEQAQEQKQVPPPVFAVAPARPPQRSFSQSQPEPQTSTETVTRSDATGESNHDDGVITLADWTGSFTSPALPATADLTGNGFLANAPADVNNLGADNILNTSSMNLDTITSDSDAIGGVGFFRAEEAGDIFNYAWISADTNLGAPLVVEAAKTATWNGHFRSAGYLALETSFTLTVDFSSARTLTAIADSASRNHSFTLNSATYNENGVIEGGITITNGVDSADGVLTGLIGQKGAVGAFHSNASGAQSYAGGFIASPTAIANSPDVTITDWRRSFTRAPATQAETTTITITSTYAYPESRTTGHQRVVYGTVYADGATEPIYAESDLAQLTPTYAEDDTAQLTPIYAEDDLAQLTPTNAIGQKILGNAATSFKDANGFLTDLDGGELILTTRVRATDRQGNPLSHTNGDPIMIDKPVELTAQQIGHINAQAMIESTLEDEIPTRTRTKTAGVKNEFLQGGAGGRLDETPRDAGPAGQVSNRGSLNLATATFDGRKLGGDAADGVAFFRGFDDIPASQDPPPHEPTYTHTHAGLAHNYAGLYSGTNLGAPVSGTSTASWNGRIRTIGYFKFDMDFTLRVTFGADNTGTLNVSRLKNPANLNQFLQITNARYDANGVISGVILIDEDMENRGIQAQYGFLTGLIGAEGAVAAFLSSGSNIKADTTTTGTKEDITDGSHRFGYAGGFVARPGVVANADVTIEDWTGSFAKALPSGVKKHVIGEDAPLNQFLLRDDPAKRPSWKKPEGGSLSLSALGGDATDGVDFFPAVITIYGYGTSGTSQNYFAGLWDSTDLGAAIPLSTNFNNEASAMWKGKFSVFQGANARFDTDFMLEVDFINNGVRTVTAIEAGAEDYYLSGRYIANGLMTGVVRRAANANNSSPKNGLISGLIGQEGLVAAFVSNIGGSGMNAENRDTISGGRGATGYAGGFVASPIPPPPDVVDVSDINYTFTRNFVHIEKPRNIETDGVEARDEIRTETEVSSDINYADIPTTVAGLA